MAADLSGKVALITGAASGLGAATARAVAARGATVIAADLDEQGGEAIAAELGGHFVRTDVSDLDQNLAATAFAAEKAGGLDLVHLNAGVLSNTEPGENFDLALYRRAMGANLDGVILGTQAVLPALKARGGGSIVATSSLGGLAAMPYEPIYAANKHAVVGFTRSMGPALAEHGIRFNAVCPGFAQSKMTEGAGDAIEQFGVPIIPAETVADTVVSLWEGEGTGECWVIQPGRDPLPFNFRNVPGPR
ncbi:MAG: SDR family NAD(P)-dependent oxidoreductase [Thermoleophilaceae bacterium]|nr:SDR family NAD(P)-dependent oxidoreductase [Thermoleophilaceae bacterium]